MDEQFSAAQDMIYDLILNTNKEKFTKDEFDATFKEAVMAQQSIAKLSHLGQKDLTEEEIDKIKRYIRSKTTVVMHRGVTVVDSDLNHKSWIKSIEDHSYWSRYYKYLKKNKKWPVSSLASIDNSTDKILDLLGNPKDKNNFFRRGLVMGDIQSGKTACYTAICNKATDAGYDIIIVLAGMIEDLRIQTQGRLDTEYIGKDSRFFEGINKRGQNIGVAKYDKNLLSAIPVTTVESDFKKAVADGNGIRLHHLNGTALFVVKKNKSVLDNLIEWLSDSCKEDADALNKTVLLIDDEADNASVNTADPDENPKAINGCIRTLLKMFERKSYLAITATPFANIFIDPDVSDNEMVGDDLFPRDFIQVLDVPSNYIGAKKIFSDEGEYRDRVKLIDVDDAEEKLPIKHKKTDIFDSLPKDLEEALNYFVLVNAVRDYRGELKAHRSMMIHMSRFTDIHGEIGDVVNGWLTTVKNDLRSYSKQGSSKAEKASKFIKALHNVFDNFNLESIAGISWEQLLHDYLKNAVLDIKVVIRNSQNKDDLLDYSSSEEGLRVIAIGGNSFSRGLTLEGLCVSYFYRHASAYDTMLQMGRWFGYRDGYEDLWYIWVDNETKNWYYKINDSVEELKADLREMARHNRAPKDFGIRIRHSAAGLLITARNKMKTASKISTGLSKMYIETPRIYLDQVEYNKKVLSEFVDKLTAQAFGNLKELEYHSGQKNYWEEVPRREIVQLLTDFQTAHWSYNFVSDHLKQYIGDLENYEYWDVCIVNGGSEEYNGFEKIKVQKSSRTVDIDPQNSNIIRVGGSKVRIATGEITQIGLTRAQCEYVEDEYNKNNDEDKNKNVPAKFYMIKDRNPVLYIHVIHPKLSKDSLSVNLPETIFGLGIGMPDTGSGYEKYDYYYNKVEQDLFVKAQNGEEDIEE